MAEEVSAGGEKPPSTANPRTNPGLDHVSASDVDFIGNPSIGPPSFSWESKPDSAKDPSPKVSAEKLASRIAYKVEYVSGIRESVVFRTDGESHEALQPGDTSHTDTSVFEFVQVNLTTTENVAWSLQKLPPVYGKGGSHIRIYSPAVISALRHVVKYYPSQKLVGKDITIQEPYAIIWHHEHALEEYRERFSPNSSLEGEASETCANKTVYEDLGILLNFVRNHYGNSVKESRERWLEGILITKMYWLFLQPGIEVYLDKDLTGQFEPYILKSVGFEMVNGEMGVYSVGAWKLRCGIYNMRTSVTSTYLDVFSYQGHIIGQKIIPCSYLDVNESFKLMGRTGKDLRKFFEERGKMFLRLRRRGCYGYHGVTKSQPVRPYIGQVMVDPEQWSAEERESGKRHNPPQDFSTLEAISAFRICSCRRFTQVVGEESPFPALFSMSGDHRSFPVQNKGLGIIADQLTAKLDVLGFQDPIFDKSILDALVMPSETKSLITRLTTKYVRSLVAKNEQDETIRAQEKEQTEGRQSGQKTNEVVEVQNFSISTRLKATRSDPPASSTWSADFVTGKGEGLIFLLHGKPGVGKTYTAECVAAHTERPLLSLTCADIGVDPGIVEKNLQKWFKIASSWGAIMLIDEADIYMEHRQVQDLARNNLVAGFLRALEYYQGILFLTTNRVGTFDEAFISRIHIMVHYPPFTDEDRLNVWDNFFGKLEDEQGEEMAIPKSTRSYVSLEEVQSLEWNGREIRNAFQVAVALAQAEESRDKNGLIQVKKEHIKSSSDVQNLQEIPEQALQQRRDSKGCYAREQTGFL